MEDSSQVIVFENLREANPHVGVPSGQVVRCKVPTASFENPNAVAGIAPMTFEEITKCATEFGERFKAATALG